MIYLPLPRSYPLLPPPGGIIHTEVRRLRRQRRRARLAGCPADLSIHEWLYILNCHRWRCALCGGAFESLEHVRPVMAGGGTTAGNCLPACTACNGARARIYTAVHAIITLPDSRRAVTADLLAVLVTHLTTHPLIDTMYHMG